MEFCANISMLYPEFGTAERIHAAARAGFDRVEIQFPSEDEIADIGAACRQARTGMIQINVPRGVGDEVGLTALPGREDDFRNQVDVCLSQARRLGVRQVNILSGRPPANADPIRCMDVYLSNIRWAADLFGQDGIRVLIEPVNRVDVPGFFLSGIDFALDVLKRADHANIAILFDFYHLAITEPDLAEAIEKAAPHIGHVQFADTPGRHEPGTGSIDFETALAALKGTGYDAVISAEYRPVNGTAEGLSWLPRFREIVA